MSRKPDTVCAACGGLPLETKTTFLCRNEERHICVKCWNEDENDEAWDMETSNRIQLRDGAIERKRSKPTPATPRESKGTEG